MLTEEHCLSEYAEEGRNPFNENEYIGVMKMPGSDLHFDIVLWAPERNYLNAINTIFGDVIHGGM